MSEERKQKSEQARNAGVAASEDSGVSFARFGLTVFYCLVILIVSKGITGKIMSKKKTAPKKPVAPFTLKAQVEDVRFGSHRLEIKGAGSVQARKNILIMPEVSGRVEYAHPQFRDGGVIKEGEILFRIEQQDYAALKKQAEANLESMKNELALQVTRKETTTKQLERARETWQISKEESDRMKRLLDQGASSESEVNRLLAQEKANMERIEQLESALSLIEPTNVKIRSGIAAAEAQLAKAALSFDKTEYRAPFDGKISGGRLEAGQFIAPGAALGKFIDTSAYEVPVPVSVTDLETLAPGLRNGGMKNNGVDVTVQWKDDRGKEYSWPGKLVRVGAELNMRTRQVDAVVEVVPQNEEMLSQGQYVDVIFKGRTLDNVAAIPRRALRDGNKVYLTEDKTLVVRDVDVWGSEGEYTYISSGLNDGELLITSVVEEVIPGMPVVVIARNGEAVKAAEMDKAGGDEREEEKVN